VVTIAQLCAVVGLRLSANAFPAGDVIRDAAHDRRAPRVRKARLSVLRSLRHRAALHEMHLADLSAANSGSEASISCNV